MLLHRSHHGTNELISTLQTKQLILPVGLVEEDDIEREGVRLCHISKFSQDVCLILTLLILDKV